MARVQYTFTFTNAQQGAAVSFSAPTYPSATGRVPNGPRRALGTGNAVTVWSDAAYLVASTVDGLGLALTLTATQANPSPVDPDGTPGDVTASGTSGAGAPVVDPVSTATSGTLTIGHVTQANPATAATWALPATATDGQQTGIKNLAGSTGPGVAGVVVTVTGNINGTAASSLPLRYSGQAKIFTWSAAQSSWIVTVGDLSVPSLPFVAVPIVVAGGNLGATRSLALSGSAETWLTGTLTANLTLSVTGLVAGARARLILAQDATGNRTLSVNDGTGAKAVTVPGTPLAAAVVELYTPDGTNLYVASGVTGPTGPAGPPGATGASGAVTGTAGGDLTGTYPNPTIGDRVVGARNLKDFARSPWVPTGYIAQCIRAGQVATSNITLTSGTLRLSGGLVLPGGRMISNLTGVSSTVAAAGSSHLWFCLIDRATLAVLAVSVDDTSASPWAASVSKTLALATPYTPADTVEAYMGVVSVATTPPSLLGAAAAGFPYTLMGLGATSTTGLTDPASLGATAGAIAQSSSSSAQFHGYVS